MNNNQRDDFNTNRDNMKKHQDDFNKYRADFNEYRDTKIIYNVSKVGEHLFLITSQCLFKYRDTCMYPDADWKCTAVQWIYPDKY